MCTVSDLRVKSVITCYQVGGYRWSGGILPSAGQTTIQTYTAVALVDVV